MDERRRATSMQTSSTITRHGFSPGDASPSSYPQKNHKQFQNSPILSSPLESKNSRKKKHQNNEVRLIERAFDCVELTYRRRGGNLLLKNGVNIVRNHPVTTRRQQQQQQQQQMHHDSSVSQRKITWSPSSLGDAFASSLQEAQQRRRREMQRLNAEVNSLFDDDHDDDKQKKAGDGHQPQEKKARTKCVMWADEVAANSQQQQGQLQQAQQQQQLQGQTPQHEPLESILLSGKGKQKRHVGARKLTAEEKIRLYNARPDLQPCTPHSSVRRLRMKRRQQQQRGKKIQYATKIVDMLKSYVDDFNSDDDEGEEDDDNDKGNDGSVLKIGDRPRRRRRAANKNTELLEVKDVLGEGARMLSTVTRGAAGMIKDTVQWTWYGNSGTTSNRKQQQQQQQQKQQQKKQQLKQQKVVALSEDSHHDGSSRDVVPEMIKSLSLSSTETDENNINKSLSQEGVEVPAEEKVYEAKSEDSLFFTGDEDNDDEDEGSLSGNNSYDDISVNKEENLFSNKNDAISLNEVSDVYDDNVRPVGIVSGTTNQMYPQDSAKKKLSNSVVGPVKLSLMEKMKPNGSVTSKSSQTRGKNEKSMTAHWTKHHPVPLEDKRIYLRNREGNLMDDCDEDDGGRQSPFRHILQDTPALAGGSFSSSDDDDHDHDEIDMDMNEGVTLENIFDTSILDEVCDEMDLDVDLLRHDGNSRHQQDSIENTKQLSDCVGPAKRFGMEKKKSNTSITSKSPRTRQEREELLTLGTKHPQSFEDERTCFRNREDNLMNDRDQNEGGRRGDSRHIPQDTKAVMGLNESMGTSKLSTINKKWASNSATSPSTRRRNEELVAPSLRHPPSLQEGDISDEYEDAISSFEECDENDGGKRGNSNHTHQGTEKTINKEGGESSENLMLSKASKNKFGINSGSPQVRRGSKDMTSFFSKYRPSPEDARALFSKSEDDFFIDECDENDGGKRGNVSSAGPADTTATAATTTTTTTATTDVARFADSMGTVKLSTMKERTKCATIINPTTATATIGSNKKKFLTRFGEQTLSSPSTSTYIYRRSYR